MALPLGLALLAIPPLPPLPSSAGFPPHGTVCHAACTTFSSFAGLSHRHSPTLRLTQASRRSPPARLSAAASPPPPQSVWESLLPGSSAGLSPRQRLRLAHMYLPHEPLPQEAIGVGILLGTLGAGVGGIFGLLMGVFNLAPCAIHAPGAAGEAFRTVGYYAFNAAAGGASRAERAWHQFEHSKIALKLGAGWSTFVTLALLASTRVATAFALFQLLVRRLLRRKADVSVLRSGEHALSGGSILTPDNQWGCFSSECWLAW